MIYLIWGAVISCYPTFDNFRLTAAGSLIMYWGRRHLRQPLNCYYNIFAGPKTCFEVGALNERARPVPDDALTVLETR